MKDSKYVTIKVLINTRRLLRIIAAQTGEQMAQVMERLCQAELDRMEQQEQNRREEKDQP